MMSSFKIVVVDDERIVRVTIADDLRDAGHKVFECTNGLSALTILKDKDIDIVITDIKMPEMNGLDLLNRIKELNEDIFVVVMTSYATVESAVEAMKKGAYDFITKPFKIAEIFIVLDRIAELKKIKQDNKQFRTILHKKYDYSSFVGVSPEIKQVFNLVNIVADSPASVLITGETGTGKELLTNVIHYNGDRKKQPLVKVSCAVLSKEIFESELFGHEKGAFTGAEKTKIGRFELSNNGTLYLDDIDDVPLDLQVKLLRALEEREIERLGGTETIKIDVKVIASTKVDLKEMVKQGKFREDLFYRLNVFPINLPPLRERKKDIEPLVSNFVKEFTRGERVVVEKEVFTILEDYDWPGNTRELKNLTERLVLLAKNNVIDASIIPFEIKHKMSSSYTQPLGNKSLVESLAEFEVNAINHALMKFANNKTKAANYLGIPPTTLRTKMDKYEID